jgi:hypothetical protein
MKITLCFYIVVIGGFSYYEGAVKKKTVSHLRRKNLCIYDIFFFLQKQSHLRCTR